jgi:hypothetical protein
MRCASLTLVLTAAGSIAERELKAAYLSHEPNDINSSKVKYAVIPRFAATRC